MVIAAVARGMMSVPVVVPAIVVPAMIAVPVVTPIVVAMLTVSIDRAGAVGVMDDSRPVLGMIDAAFADTAGSSGHSSDRSQHHNEFQSHFCLP
jgi:hypothetical protein